jgi:hypothetical protein
MGGVRTTGGQVRFPFEAFQDKGRSREGTVESETASRT